MPIYNNEDYIKVMRPIPKDWPLDIFGIPFVKKSSIDISKINNGLWLINFENAKATDHNASNKIIHFFKFDDSLNRAYNSPYKVLHKLGPYYAVSTMDFSMHPGMTEAQIISATFKNRWTGVWAQINGIKKVAVTVGWVLEDTFDICFAGIEDGTLLIISTLGACLYQSKELFLKGYAEMRKRFPNSQVLCIGNKIDGMDNDVCYVKYDESFGNWDNKRNYWQPSMFNWDLSKGWY